jgi:hypothetical protein
MTRRISLVAVCCSSASVTCPWASVSARFFSCSSVNSRTFWMAITAWSAKVLSNSICLCESAPASAPVTVIPPIGLLACSIGTVRTLREAPAFARAWSLYSGPSRMFGM